MTLREGRADLHQRLAAAIMIGPPWPEQAMLNLLAEARDAVLRCPHDCALCTQVERKEQG